MSSEKENAFYVSPDGNDKNTGTVEYPFKTVAAAVKAVRKSNKDMQEDITVYLRGGRYRISNPIELTSEDSGANGHRILYRSFPGEVAIISSEEQVRGWVIDTETGIKNLWKASVPQIDHTRHMFVNGRKAVRTHSEVKQSHGWDILDDPDMKFYNLIGEYHGHMGKYDIYEGYKTRKKELAAWRNKRDIEFVYDVGWTHSICPVEDIVEVEDGAIVKMRMPCFHECQTKGVVRVGSPSYMENAFELFSGPGEWYFDRADRIVYYIPLEGEDMQAADVIIPVAESLLSIKGSLDSCVKNISFEGIVFRYSTWLQPSLLGHAEVQANLTKDPDNDTIFHASFKKPKAAIELDAAVNIQFEGCTFHDLGSTAVDIQNGSCSNTIRGCEFRDISGSGIQIGGFTLEDAHPSDSRRIVRGNAIINNYLHDIGAEYKGGIPILAGYVCETLIAHNEICQASYSGISVGWGWGYWDEFSDARISYKPPEHYPRFYKPTVAAENHIEYNHIHHVMQKLHDGAGIYTLSMQAGSIIRGNHIHDNGAFSGEGYEEDMLVGNVFSIPEDVKKRVSSMTGFPGGIYLDEASGGFEICENLVYNVVVPFNYHDVGMNGRYETNNIHDNYFNMKPEDNYLTQEIKQKAGLEEQYRKLFI